MHGPVFKTPGHGKSAAGKDGEHGLVLRQHLLSLQHLLNLQEVVEVKDLVLQEVDEEEKGLQQEEKEHLLLDG